MAKKAAEKIAQKFFVMVLIASLLLAFQPATSFAQMPAGEEKAELSGTRKQLATIVFAGLAGAILGLSTLSFYGRPQDHLENIAIGFAIGVIGGASYTTYKAATQPYDAFDMNTMRPPEFDPSKEYALREIRPMAKWRWEF